MVPSRAIMTMKQNKFVTVSRETLDFASKVIMADHYAKAVLRSANIFLVEWRQVVQTFNLSFGLRYEAHRHNESSQVVKLDTLKKYVLFSRHATNKKLDVVVTGCSMILEMNQRAKKAKTEKIVFISWLAAVPGNKHKAFCKFCKQEFRAHRTDLRCHAKSKKHQKAYDRYTKKHSQDFKANLEISTSEKQSPANRNNIQSQSCIDDSNKSQLLTIEPSKLQLQTIEPSKSQLQNIEPSKLQLLTNESSKLQLQTIEPSTLQLQTIEPTKSQLQPIEPNKSQLQTIEPSKLQLLTNEPIKSQLQTIEPSKSHLQINEPSKSHLQINDPITSQSDIIRSSQPILQINESNKSQMQINKSDTFKFGANDCNNLITSLLSSGISDSKNLQMCNLHGTNNTRQQLNSSAIELQQGAIESRNLLPHMNELGQPRGLEDPRNTPTYNKSSEQMIVETKPNCLFEDHHVGTALDSMSNTGALKSSGIISTQVMDLTRGSPLGQITVGLFLMRNKKWVQLAESVLSKQFLIKYHQAKRIKMADFPVSVNQLVTFDVCNPNEHYHLTLLLSPFGYMAFRGDTLDNWSLIRPSPSNKVFNVECCSSKVTVDISGRSLTSEDLEYNSGDEV
uniref:Transthyretin/hydroxyisourate hydrolase domain-containing protein n=1 Tax=Timema bartmani TaxID=61472 RepID=A0A7R9HZF7_9NEOP|nr:unnamed protein product [Timema bartmani]